MKNILYLLLGLCAFSFGVSEENRITTVEIDNMVLGIQMVNGGYLYTLNDSEGNVVAKSDSKEQLVSLFPEIEKAIEFGLRDDATGPTFGKPNSQSSVTTQVEIKEPITAEDIKEIKTGK